MPTPIFYEDVKNGVDCLEHHKNIFGKQQRAHKYDKIMTKKCFDYLSSYIYYAQTKPLYKIYKEIQICFLE